MKDQRKHIVLIAAWFFPENRVASFRLNAFAKYLNKDKFKVTVVSLNHAKGATQELLFDDVLVYREPYSTLVRIRKQQPGDSFLKHKLYALNNKLVSRFSLYDYPGWTAAVVARLETIQVSNSIDLIISSYAPVDAHLAAHAFKKKFPEVKWIADMRDEMSRNRFLSAQAKSKLAGIEKRIADSIDGLTTVSAPILNDFKALLHNTSIKYKEVRNGFDHDYPPSTNFSRQFTFLYAGTFYAQIKPDTLFAALTSLEKLNALEGNWTLKLLGTHRNFNVPKELVKHVHFMPPVPNEQAVGEMMAADCSILIHPPMGTHGVYSGKLFEYLSTGKPVLALVDTEDVAAKLINEMNAGEVVDFYDVDGIKKAILKIHSDWKNHNLPKVDPEKIKKLHRKHQVSLLEELIDEIL